MTVISAPSHVSCHCNRKNLVVHCCHGQYWGFKHRILIRIGLHVISYEKDLVPLSVKFQINVFTLGCTILRVYICSKCNHKIAITNVILWSYSIIFRGIFYLLFSVSQLQTTERPNFPQVPVHRPDCKICYFIGLCLWARTPCSDQICEARAHE